MQASAKNLQDKDNIKYKFQINNNNKSSFITNKRFHNRMLSEGVNYKYISKNRWSYSPLLSFIAASRGEFRHKKRSQVSFLIHLSMVIDLQCTVAHSFISITYN